MHNHKEIKIRESLFYLLREEEENLPLIERKIRESNNLIERERKRIEKEREEFLKEMENEKEKLIIDGINKIGAECERIYEKGKKKAEELFNNIESYKETALRVFEEIILKGKEE